MQAVKDALCHLTQFTTYDPNGVPTSVIDPNGQTISLKYDERGRLLSD